MIPKPPPDLSPASQKRWRGFASDLAVVNNGACAEVDYLVLADVLRACDRLAAVGEQLAADGVVVTGSMGQPRPHPLISVEQSLRKEVVQGLERLGLAPRSSYYGVNHAGRIVEE